MVDRALVLAALSQVQDPDLKRDLVSLQMIQDLVIQGSCVNFTVRLTTPACPLKAQIERECRAAVSAVPGVSQIEIKMDAQVKAHQTKGNTGSQKIPGVGQIIAVSSGKGGVGKSTVAVNLAVALHLEGARVGLMDADIYGPNLPTMMGVTDLPKMIKDPARGELFIPPSAHGVQVMSMGFLIQGDQPAVWRGPMLHSVVSQFCHQVHWGELDYLVVDMPPGTGDVQLSLAQLVPVTGAILVTTPQEVSMQDVRKAYHMFEKVRIPILGIVENMSYLDCPSCEARHFIFGQGGGRALAKKFATECLTEIPLLLKIREGGDLGKPITVEDPDSPLARQFRDLAKRVAQQVSIQEFAAEHPGGLLQIGRFS